MLTLALLGAALATPLAEPGEVLGGCEVTELTEHPEFQRVTLALPDGRPLSVEATRAEGGGACTHHGVTLFPRWELLGESVEAEDQPAAVQALCDRLEARGAALSLRPVQAGQPQQEGGPDDAVADDAEPTWITPGPDTPRQRSWLHGALLALLLTGLAAMMGPGRRAWAALPRVERRDLLAVAALGLGARLLLSPRLIFWAPFFGYGRLTEAWGVDLAHPLYGGGYAALMGPASWLSGDSPGAVFGVNLALAALAPPTLWALTRLLVPGRWPALIAGVSLALLPMHLRLSATEAMHVSLTTFEGLSVLGAVAFTRSPRLSLAAMSALAIGYAAHIRPEALAALLVPVGWVLAKAERRHAPGVVLAAGIIAGMVGLRLLDMLAGPGQSAVSYGKLLTPLFWLHVLVPSPLAPGVSANTHSFLQMGLTPPLLPALAALAFFGPRRRLALALLGWWALTALPVLPKSWPLADALRLQLPATLPSLLLAALGAEHLLDSRRWISHRALLIGVIGLSLLYVPQVRGPWAPQAEHPLLRGWIPRLPEGATVLYDDGGPHHEGFGRWASAAGPHQRWRGMSRLDQVRTQPDAEPLMAYIGTSCALTRPPRGEDDYGPLKSACPEVLERCTLRPWETETLSTKTDVDVQLEAAPTVGFYFLEGCE